MNDWHTIRITYHDPQDRLVADVVGPLLAELRTYTDDVWFARHWRRGPHVRLHVRCPDDVFAGRVEPRVRAVAGRFLRDRPSTAQLDAGALAPLHRELARAEQDAGALTPWDPDNTVRVTRYDTRRHVLGAAEAEMAERFAVHTADLAVDMTRAVADGASRSRLAFDLVVATAHGLSGAGIGRGFVSLRSHSEAHLTYSADGAARRRRWAEEYRQRSDALRSRLRTVVAAVDAVDAADRTSVAFVRPWLDRVGALRTRVDELVADGRMTLSAGTTGDPGRDAPVPDPGSTYHRWMSETHRDRAAVEQSPWFLTYRWVLNCTYLHLTRIGLAPVDRYLLCTWIADAVEEEYTVDAFDVARRMLAEATT